MRAERQPRGDPLSAGRTSAYVGLPVLCTVALVLALAERRAQADETAEQLAQARHEVLALELVAAHSEREVLRLRVEALHERSRAVEHAVAEARRTCMLPGEWFDAGVVPMRELRGARP